MKKLKQEYEARGYTGRTFAKAIGLTTPLLSNINKGAVNPTPGTFKKMQAELNCAPDDIIMPGEFDYSVTVPKAPRPRKDAYKKRFYPRLEPDVHAEAEALRRELNMTQGEYIAFCNRLVQQYLDNKKRMEGVA